MRPAVLPALTASTSRTRRRTRAAHRWRVVPSLALSLTCTLGQRGPAIHGNVAKLLRLAARPAHAQTHGVSGRAEPNQHTRIVRGCVTTIRTRTTPQWTSTLANHFDSRTDLITRA